MNPNRARDAGVAELSSILPGDNLAVFYSDDTVWHERITLWPVKRGTGSGFVWWIVTPDFDVYPEDLNDPSEGPARVRIRGKTFKYWSRFTAATYRFADALTDEERRRYMKEAIAEMRDTGGWDDTNIPRAIVDAKGREVPPSIYLPGVVMRRRIPMRGGGVMLEENAPVSGYTQDLHGLVSPLKPAPEGHLWVSAEFTETSKPGDEIEVVAGRGVMVDFKTALVPFRGGYLKVQKVRVEDVPAFAERIKGLCKEEIDDHLREELGGSKDAAVAKNGEDEGPDDARVLPIDYDAHGERYKEMRQVVQESEEFSWKDWPMEPVEADVPEWGLAEKLAADLGQIQVGARERQNNVRDEDVGGCIGAGMLL